MAKVVEADSVLVQNETQVTITEWQVPWKNTRPSPNRFVGFNPETEKFFARTPIGSGGGTVRNMVFHAPSKTVWFGTDTNYLGRADVDF